MVLSGGLDVTFHDLEERLSECLVEERVEEWVDHGRGVAQPGDQVNHLLFDMGPTRDEDVSDEERRPQKNEGEENHPQNLWRAKKGRVYGWCGAYSRTKAKKTTLKTCGR